MRAMRIGCRFVAVEEAPVYEVVPEERWKKSYWLRRAVANGFNAHSYVAGRKFSPSKIIIPLKSAILTLAYAAAMPIFAFIGPHAVVKYAEKGAHHVSRLAAMLGIQLVKKREF
jgi:hypothetical protein